MRFIHAADVHLDSPLVGLERYEGAPVEELRCATRAALANLVDLAVEENATFVLIAGDLYDGDWRDYNTGLCFVREMGRLRKAGIRVFLVAGNHDAQNNMTKALALPGNVTLFGHRGPETVQLDDLGVAIHGQSYATRAVTANLAAGFPERVAGVLNVGLLHTNVDAQEGYDNYAPSRLADLQSMGSDYWALGHVHAPQTLSRDPWVVYSGNTQGRHARETGPRGCFVVQAENGVVGSVGFRQLDVARWVVCQIDATETRDADEIVDRAIGKVMAELERAEGRYLVARVEINGPSLAHAELSRAPAQWESEVRARALDRGNGRVWIERVRFGTRLAIDLDGMASRDDALGALLRRIRDLDASAENLAALVPDLQDLARKLPADLTSGEDALRLDDRSLSHGILDEVRELVLGRILSSGGPS